MRDATTQIAMKFMKSRKMRDAFLQRDSRRVLELYVIPHRRPSALSPFRQRSVAVLRRTHFFLLGICSACEQSTLNDGSLVYSDDRDTVSLSLM